MEQKLKKVAPGLYERKYLADGRESAAALYYGRLQAHTGKRMLFALGPDLREAKDQWDIIKIASRRGEDLSRFKPRKPVTVDATPVLEPMTVSKWSEIYLDLTETKAKRSFERDCQLVEPLKCILGSVRLTDLTRDDLVDYSDRRRKEHIIHGGKAETKTDSAGTVANELSCLRAMLNLAFVHKDAKQLADDGTERRKYPQLEGFQIGVSFKKLIVRSQRDRILDADEETKLLEAYPTWMKRIAIVARETCLSEGDIIRLTKSMIKEREIVPEGGRKKSKVKQRAPLTDAVLDVLRDIDRDKLKGAIVANVNGLIFTREDGKPITKDMITCAIKTARRRTKITDFKFHDYRHCAKTQWAREGRTVDAAMLAAGHSSVEMHNRYVNLKPGDVAKAFGLGKGTKVVNTSGEQEASEQQASLAK